MVSKLFFSSASKMDRHTYYYFDRRNIEISLGNLTAKFMIQMSDLKFHLELTDN